MNEQEIRNDINDQLLANHLLAIKTLTKRFAKETLKRIEIEVFVLLHDPLGKFIDEKYNAYMETRGMTP